MKRLFLFSILTMFLMVGCSPKSSITLEGDIQNNIISAISSVPGKITTMNKQLGESVKKGDIIAVIDNTNQKYIVDQFQGIVNMKQAKLEELKVGPRPEELETAQAQVRATKAQLDLLVSGNKIEQIEQAKNDVSIAQENVDVTKLTSDNQSRKYKDAIALFNEGVLSQYELDNEKNKYDTTSSQLASARYRLESAKQQLILLQDGATPQAISVATANYDAANAQYKLLQSGATQQTIVAAQADLDQSIAQLKQAQNNLENCNITSLAEGIIISKNFQLGDVVNVGSNIADIAMSEDIYVLCYIPVKYLDKIYYNQELDVTTSNGAQKGTISYIALNSEYTPKDKQSEEDSKHSSIKIKVAIKDDEGIIKSGMTAEVEVPLNNKATTNQK